VDNERDARDLQNPYAYIDGADDEAQPYHVRGDVMPWEKSRNVLHQRASHIDGVRDSSTPPPEVRFDDALSFSASGNLYANIDCDDDGAQPYYLSGEAKPWERSEQLNTKNFGNPYRNIDCSSNEAQPYSSAGETPPWEKASSGKQSSLANPAWARSFIAEQMSRRSASVSKRYTDEQIEKKARALQIELWQHRHDIWRENSPVDPMHVLDAAKALDLLGFRVRYQDGGLGQFQQGRKRIDVAGLIDPASKTVEISTLASPTERVFTLAHELGHVMLGSVGAGVHRDRALSGSAIARDPIERAADKFAAYFLMPRKLVYGIFSEYFLTGCFTLTDETAFALRTTTLDVVKKDLPTLRDLSLWLASTERYNSRGFRSLAERFNVSVGAMAIRLEELGLVRE